MNSGLKINQLESCLDIKLDMDAFFNINLLITLSFGTSEASEISGLFTIIICDLFAGIQIFKT